MRLNPNDDRISAPALDSERLTRMKEQIQLAAVIIDPFDAKEEGAIDSSFREIATAFNAVLLIDPEITQPCNDDDCTGKKRIRIPSGFLEEKGLEETTRAFCHEIGHVIQRNVFGGSGKKTEHKSITEYVVHETEANVLGLEVFRAFLADKMNDRAFCDLVYPQLQKVRLLQVLTVFDMIEDDRPPEWRTPGENASWSSIERRSFSEPERRKKYVEIMENGYCS